MAYFPANVAVTSLSSGVSSSVTDLPVEDGSSYPDPTAVGHAPYKILVGFGTSREEMCLVTSKPSPDVLRVTRGVDSSPASSKNSGDIVVPAVGPADMTYFAAKVDRSGDTMTGALTLSGDPLGDLEAATKQYSDGKQVKVTRSATEPLNPKEGDVWIADVTSGLTDIAPADMLTNALRWGWGLDTPGTSIVAEAGGMRINWALNTMSLPGRGHPSMVPGHTYRFEVLLEVPVGSPVARPGWFLRPDGGPAGPGLTTRLVMDVPYVSGSTFLGIRATGGAVTAGSVLVKEYHVYDVTNALPTTRVFDDAQRWVTVRDPLGPVSFVSIDGDTMTGALTLPGNPSADLHAAPKQYVDATVLAATDQKANLTPQAGVVGDYGGEFAGMWVTRVGAMACVEALLAPIGTVTSATPLVIGTIPVGFRPAHRVITTALLYYSGSSYDVARVDLRPNGEILLAKSVSGWTAPGFLAINGTYRVA